MRDPRLRTPDDLLAHVARLLRLVPAVGAGLVSASAIGAVIGAIYLQALFDGVHAGWAMDLVPTSTILRTGLLGASAGALALAGLLPNTIIQASTLRVMIFLLLVHAVGATTFAALRFWAAPVFVAHWYRYLDLGVLVFAAYAVGQLVAILVALRITSRKMRGQILGISVLVGFLTCVVAPLKQGQHEAEVAIDSAPSASHPDVCIKADPLPWRLIRVLDSQMLLTRVGAAINGTMRLVPDADVLLVMPRAPMGGTAAACSNLQAPTH